MVMCLVALRIQGADAAAVSMVDSEQEVARVCSQVYRTQMPGASGFTVVAAPGRYDQSGPGARA